MLQNPLPQTFEILIVSLKQLVRSKIIDTSQVICGVLMRRTYQWSSEIYSLFQGRVLSARIIQFANHNALILANMYSILKGHT